MLKFKKIAAPFLISCSTGGRLGVEMPPYRVFDLDEVEDYEPYIDLCRDPKGVADSVGLLSALCADTRWLAQNTERVLYIIGVEDEPITKIGVSADPIKRLADLQQGHYQGLFLHSVYFCPKTGGGKLEQAALKDAADIRLRGEWVAEWPHEAAARVLRVSAEKKIGVCDGATWQRASLARTQATARGLKSYRAYGGNR